MTTAVQDWGRTAAGPARRVTIGDGGACQAVLTDFGARLVELWLPDKAGQRADVVLGHDRVEDYDTTASRYVGATCGRYGNRIAGARFVLDGQTHHLQANEGPNQLHGGAGGFDLRLWSLAWYRPDAAMFRLTSADGDMGFPGRLTAEVTYAFTAPACLEIRMTAQVADRPTVVNLVNHAYFNLAGQGSGPIDDHLLQLAAQSYLPVDQALIPLGAPVPVAQTPFDFRTARPLAASVPPGGFDHNFCLDAGTAPQITLVDPVSGRGLRLWTDQPGVQIYTAGHIPEGFAGKGGARLGARAGMAIETQRWPDSPNHPDFPSAVLRPGETYLHRMRFDFFAG